MSDFMSNANRQSHVIQAPSVTGPVIIEPTISQELDVIGAKLHALLERRNIPPEARRKLENACDAVLNVYCNL